LDHLAVIREVQSQVVLQFSGGEVIRTKSVWYIHVGLLSLVETPDLVFTSPLTPDGHGGAWRGVAMVGEIDVEVFVMDEDADEEIRQRKVD